jgi:LytS/YehU family sensor histidine kinase
VGLANIKERLEQAYGDKHLFETLEPPEGGFAVIIELPLETAASIEGAADVPAVATAAE